MLNVIDLGSNFTHLMIIIRNIVWLDIYYHKRDFPGYSFKDVFIRVSEVKNERIFLEKDQRLDTIFIGHPRMDLSAFIYRNIFSHHNNNR